MSGGLAPVRWQGGADGHLVLLDQRLLPLETVFLDVGDSAACAEAIRAMVVRGAPAIAFAAAWGVVLACREADAGADLEAALQRLADARPTAVNLRWGVDRMRRAITGLDGSERIERAMAEATAIGDEDVASNRAIGDAGAALLPDGARVLTICNTGSLATAGWGTALGIVRSAHRDGRLAGVLACETRPYLQGARLTMYELMADGVPVELITDSMAAFFMARGEVDAVIAGADRVAANGDTANKIGTYGLAVLAAYHGIPFYIAAPISTLDPATADGGGIAIEERGADEVLTVQGVRIAPPGARARHPAFDVTPGSLIAGIVTERGVLRPPYGTSIAALFGSRDA